MMHLQNEVYSASVGYTPTLGWFVIVQWTHPVEQYPAPICEYYEMEDRKVLSVLKQYGFGHKLQDVKVQLQMRGDV
jgi:hypothetical protein